MARDWRKLVCPKCSRYWADLDFADYPDFQAKHVRIVWGTRKKLRNGAGLTCSDCGYEYTTWDVVLAGASPAQGELKPGERQEIP